MARDLEEAIVEEEAREVHEAEDNEEQANPKEYDDDGGENTAATVGNRGGGTLEFVCTKCGKKAGGKRGAATPLHHGRAMTPVDKEPVHKQVVGRLLAALRHAASKLAFGKEPAAKARKAAGKAKTRAKAKRKARAWKPVRKKAGRRK